MVQPPAQDAVNVVIVGAGNACPAHLRGIAELEGEGIRVTGVCDLDQGRARRMADRFGVDRVYPDVDAVLADPSVTVVGIATPPAAHATLAIAFLEAGKSAVVEKPMSVDLDGCERMLAAEQDGHGRLFVVQNRVYTDAMQRMRRIIGEGGIGTPMVIQTNGLEGTDLIQRMPSLRTDRHGVVGTQIFHNLYVVPWLIGDEIRSIDSAVSRGPSSRLFATDENAAAIIRYEGGAMHVAVGTFGRPSGMTEHTVHVIGSEGELRSERVGDQDHRRELLHVVGRGGGAWEEVPLRNPQARGYEFAQMWRDYVGALQTGGEPMMTTTSAIRTMQRVDDLYRSAAERPPVLVREREPVENRDRAL